MCLTIYTPAINYFGPDSFTFKVNDGVMGDSDIATVSITVTPVNDPPVADAQAVITPENTPRAIILTGSDPDLDPLTLRSSGPLAEGLERRPAECDLHAECQLFRA